MSSNDEFSANIYISITGLVFATVWASGVHIRADSSFHLNSGSAGSNHRRMSRIASGQGPETFAQHLRIRNRAFIDTSENNADVEGKIGDEIDLADIRPRIITIDHES
jgi:hypothetical protein